MTLGRKELLFGFENFLASSNADGVCKPYSFLDTLTVVTDTNLVLEGGNADLRRENNERMTPCFIQVDVCVVVDVQPDERQCHFERNINESNQSKKQHLLVEHWMAGNVQCTYF